MGVSMIQSIYHSFGSGRMIPGTGIIPHNRGTLFSLDASHLNVVAPGKRPYHTLSPAMVLSPDDSLRMVLGTPGGDGQTQTISQVIANVLRGGLTPQAAVEAARWRWYGASPGTEAGVVAVEEGMPDSAAAALASAGLRVVRRPYGGEFGGAQAVLLDGQTGVRWVGADPRREGYGLAW
jgi:gamma-glutamyltranspeptidase/glutathione hydrolase